MKRAKGTAKNDIGKFSRKKRFGKSIKNRCPSGFQITVEKKYKVTGCTYIPEFPACLLYASIRPIFHSMI